MKILAVETSTAVCGVAMIEDGTIVSERSMNTPHVHSEKLVMLIDEVLKEAQRTVKDLEGIAVSAGPGSFTGLRIGLSVVKGLAFAHDLPLIAVPTLKALAYNGIRYQLSGQGNIVVPLIDARREDVYAAQYRVLENNIAEVMDVTICALGELYQQIPKEHRVILLGDGAEKFHHFLSTAVKKDSSRFMIPETAHRLCSAASVGLLGELMFRNGERADTASLEPMYVKDFYTTVKRQHAQVQ